MPSATTWVALAVIAARRLWACNASMLRVQNPGARMSRPMRATEGIAPCCLIFAQVRRSLGFPAGDCGQFRWAARMAQRMLCGFSTMYGSSCPEGKCERKGRLRITPWFN